MKDIVNQSIEKKSGFVKRYWKWRGMEYFKNEIKTAKE